MANVQDYQNIKEPVSLLGTLCYVKIFSVKVQHVVRKLVPAQRT